MKHVSHLTPRDCTGTLALLDDFCADALSVESNRKILDHLDGCASCRDEYSRRLLLRESLREEWKKIRTPAGLEQKVRAVTQERPVDSRIRRLGIVAVIVLGVVVSLVIPLLFRGVPAPQETFVEFVTNHYECRQSGFTLPEEAVQPIRAWANNPAEPLDLISAHHCRGPRGPFRHFLFRVGDRQVSLMLVDRSESVFRIPDTAQQYAVGNLNAFVVDGANELASLLQLDRYAVCLVDERDDLQVSLDTLLSILEPLRTVS